MFFPQDFRICFFKKKNGSTLHPIFSVPLKKNSSPPSASRIPFPCLRLRRFGVEAKHTIFLKASETHGESFDGCLKGKAGNLSLGYSWELVGWLKVGVAGVRRVVGGCCEIGRSWSWDLFEWNKKWSAWTCFHMFFSMFKSIMPGMTTKSNYATYILMHVYTSR